MTNEKFFQILSGIDSKLVEKASEDMLMWQETREGESVSAGAPRRASLWIAIASVACAAAVVVGGAFLIRNIRKNGSFGIGGTSESSSDQSGDSENSVPVSSESSSGQSDGSESMPAVDNDPTKLSYEDMKFEAVDPFDDTITYTWAVEPDRISYEISYDSEAQREFEVGDIPMQYMYEFFGNGNSPVWVGPLHWKRCLQDGHFEFEVAQDEYVCAPVGGRVITVADPEDVYGKAVAVEIPGEKIFVMYHLDEVYVKVGDVVTEDQELGFCDVAGAVINGKHQPVMVIMKKKTDPPEQELSKDLDGLTLGITTNKNVYEVGEPIHLTATLENNTGRDIYVSYGGSDSFKLHPRIEDLVEYPRRDRWANDDLAGFKVLMQGEKVVQDFTFQTYTDYCREIVSADYDGVLKTYPDPNKPAESGTYFGYLAVTVYDIPNLDVDEGETYTLEFAVGIKGEDAEEIGTTYTHYTEDMLKDYFIYNGVLYTNCYTDHIDWATALFEQLEPGKVGELVAVINGKADLQRFKDDTANVLPKGAKIYEFPDNRELLIARTGDDYTPYMAMVEG